MVFAVQNVISDAPFTKLDLISCRNLLIYLDLELQNKLFPMFHYSLRPGGASSSARPRPWGLRRPFLDARQEMEDLPATDGACPYLPCSPASGSPDPALEETGAAGARRSQKAETLPGDRAESPA